MTGPIIRPARPEEAAALSDLCFRSKAHWGYDAAFMARCRAALAVSGEAIAAGRVFVAEGPKGRALGILKLGIEREDAAIDLLFVEPAAMGLGIGRALWLHAVALARAAGCRRLTVLSDPYAAAFYQAMGATDGGVAPSDSIPGRTLPVLVMDLTVLD
ncbi:MAG TPA: GNAT family N-acetyltransferase [Alphaproteobacteria bacterium]|nr:GNAT family N-acetyltransferase [Alphaproteobacteria bacterium]